MILMKNILFIVILSLLIIGCSKITTNSTNETQAKDLVKLTFQPIQCEKTPWDQWYAQGNIQFFKAPTEKELIVTYYSNKANTEILDATRVESKRVVCQTCRVCPTSYYYTATVNQSDAQKMLELGWRTELYAQKEN